VLLLVLVVLAVAAAALAGVSRMSLRKALHARRAEEELQRRWAVVSCRSVLLPKAEAVLSRAGKQTGVAAAEVRREVHFGGQDLTLVFGDEQAKANVNLLYRSGGLAAADRAVRRAVNTADVAVDLRPLPGQPGVSPEGEAPPPVFEAFAQVFKPSPPAALIETAGSARASPASVLTCWGDGSLHFRRAPADAVREVCGRHTGGALANRLVQIRDKHPEADLASALDQIKLSEPAREALEELLTEESNCHSLWIITRSRDRSVYDLAVLDQSSEEGGRPLVLSW
jgi:hypothetical protein